MSISIRPIITKRNCHEYPYKNNNNAESAFLYNTIVQNLYKHTKNAIECKVDCGTFIIKFSDDPYDFHVLMNSIKEELKHTIIYIKDGHVVINPNHQKECDYIRFEVNVIE